MSIPPPPEPRNESRVLPTVTCVWRDEPCDKVGGTRNLCSRHRQRAEFLRIIETYPNRVRSAPAGRWLDKDGYVVTRLVENGPILLEHRVVMEGMLGRPLKRGENVHHFNGVRHDNRPENLELWILVQPAGRRASDAPHCETCSCGR